METTTLTAQEREDQATEKMLHRIKGQSKAQRMTKEVLGETSPLPNWYTPSTLINPINRYEDAVRQRVELTYKDSKNADPKIEVVENKKYWKVIVSVYGSRSVHSFVDRETGEILKPAGWGTPAKTKGKRGNIKNADDGSGALDSHGVRYLN